MPRVQKEDRYQAILFVEGQNVTRQMRYSEFEAFLDGVLTATDLADRDVHMVYAELDRKLRPLALVFFTVYFDEEGRADPEWNIPLERLAKVSASGPDLGAGPVKLACRSQCAINWHQRELWDPDMSPGGNDFQVIRKALSENRLGLEVLEDEPAPDIPVLEPSASEAPGVVVQKSKAQGLDAEKVHRIKLARVLREQRLRIKTLDSKHRAEMAEITRQSRLQLQESRNKMQALEQSAKQAKVRHNQLLQKLQKREQQFVALEHNMKQSAKKSALLEKEIGKAVSADEAERIHQRLEDELTILKEQLDRREVELFYRDEREEQLKSELHALKSDLASKNSSDVLNQLSQLDVVFVAYHPGAGHMNIPLKDVQRYIRNPQGYAAERCNVSDEQYRHWLEHYECQMCEYEVTPGKICGESIDRVTAPSDFVDGISDRCFIHRKK